MAMQRLAAGRHLRPGRSALHTSQRLVRSKHYIACSQQNAVAPASSRPRGAFIVFEGIDRCGKSTQSRLLVDYLRKQGVAVESWACPDRSTPVGRILHGHLSGGAPPPDPAVLALLFAANRFEMRQRILALLAGGTTVVLDRYSHSGVAYAAAQGGGPCPSPLAPSPAYLRGLEAGLPAPDTVLLCSLPPEEAAARKGYGQEVYEKVDFQRKVAEQYRLLADERWVTVDATRGVEEVHGQVVAAAERVVAAARAGALPLGALWDYAPMELPPPPPPPPEQTQTSESAQAREAALPATAAAV